MFQVGDRVRLNKAYIRYACSMANHRKVIDRPERIVNRYRDAVWCRALLSQFKMHHRIATIFELILPGDVYYDPITPRVRIRFSESDGFLSASYGFDTFDLEKVNEQEQ
jgi:hypothetical protein